MLNRLPVYLLVLLVAATVLYVRIRLLSTPLERDEGEYAYMAQLLLKGIPPYTDAYTMKLPGVALAYALFMAIFGQNAAGIRIGLTLINTASIGLVYLLGNRFLAREAAITAAAFYALLSLSQSVLGIFAHATHLVVFFSLAGMVMLDSALNKRQPALVFLAGTGFGMAFLMKQHAAVLVLFALACQIWPSEKENGKLFLRNCASFLTGATAPYFIVALWLFKAGVFDRFWFWTVQYALEYAAGLTIKEGLKNFIEQSLPIVHHQLPICLLAVIGLLALLRTDSQQTNKSFIIGFLLASFAMICPGLYFRQHYFVLLLPAASLLAAYAVPLIAEFSIKSIHHSFIYLISPLLIISAAGYNFYSEKEYLFSHNPSEVSRMIYRTNPFPEAFDIASYIRKNSTRDDRIAILGSEPEILFYADRLSATGHIYMYGLMENHKYAGIMQSQLIEEIERADPLFLVVVHNSASWALQPNSLNRILDWGDSYISLRYDEVGIIEIFGDRPTNYLWDEAAVGHAPETESFVSIYRRRW